jgi:hypothetical protein
VGLVVSPEKNNEFRKKNSKCQKLEKKIIKKSESLSKNYKFRVLMLQNITSKIFIENIFIRFIA